MAPITPSSITTSPADAAVAIASDGRLDFDPKTRQLVGMRSAYRCNFPGCDQITIGPGEGEDDVSDLGVISHIYSAAKSGPRGRGGLTDHEIRSHSNAIWTCRDHSKVIDDKKGAAYPAPVLRGYKALHEARIARELRGSSSRFGWIHSVHIKQNPIFVTGVKIYFGKLTLLTGANGTGKSAICEWIDSISHPDGAARWRAARSGTRMARDISIELDTFNPERLTVKVDIRGDSTVHLKNDTDVPWTFGALQTLFIPEPPIRHCTEETSRDVLFAGIFGVAPEIVRNIAPYVNRFGTGLTQSAEFRREDRRWGLYAAFGDRPEVEFAMLSGGEQARLTVDIAMCLARVLSERTPTLLIIDAGSLPLDDAWHRHCTEIFLGSRATYQTLVVLPTRDLDGMKVEWSGWEIVRLSKSDGRTHVSQRIRERGQDARGGDMRGA